MRALLALLSLVTASGAGAAPTPRPAPPPVVPVAEDYFGTKVIDNYRYMETAGDPVFNAWIRAQGKYARAVFDAVGPRAATAARLTAFTGDFGSVNTFQHFGNASFWLERGPGSDNFDLMVRVGATTRKLVDVAALRAANGDKPAAINYFAASSDGRKVAVGLSEGGSERASLSVYDVADGKRIAGPLDRAQLGPPSWSDDSKLILINRLAPEKPGASPADRYLDNTAMSWDMTSEPVALFGGGVTTSVIKPDRVQFNVVVASPGSPVWLALVINGVQTNGPGNIPEFGTIKDAAGFRNLLAMDGYQAVRDGVAYPPMMITTGLNDPRVDSWQPAKLAARMQAANPKNVVLLRVDEEAGHGIGSTKTQTDLLYADMITFMNWQLGKSGWEIAP